MKNFAIVLSLVLAVALLTSLRIDAEAVDVDTDTSVWEVLQELSVDAPNHLPDESIDGASAERGEQIVKYGITAKPSGGKIEKQSNHFVCTTCHNIQIEDPDLANPDPEARLTFVQQKGMPFLQGTTLYGAVNRESYYNGDYEKKYGDLVEPARNNLREAIQLCAIECSQGRRLKDWELESVLKYLWTLELKVGDLALSEEEQQVINNTSKANAAEVKSTVDLLQSKYSQGATVHFVKPPEDRKAGYGLTGDPERGKIIYELGCQHCHEKERYSYFNLNDSRLTFKHLEKHIDRYSRYSIYQVARYGTSPVPGKRAYMPQYTKEKMSDQQLEDLRAYIELRVKN
jgi:mono/diheme cytochrome c family protein